MAADYPSSGHHSVRPAPVPLPACGAHQTASGQMDSSPLCVTWSLRSLRQAGEQGIEGTRQSIRAKGRPRQSWTPVQSANGWLLNGLCPGGRHREWPSDHGWLLPGCRSLAVRGDAHPAQFSQGLSKQGSLVRPCPKNHVWQQRPACLCPLSASELPRRGAIGQLPVTVP